MLDFFNIKGWTDIPFLTAMITFDIGTHSSLGTFKKTSMFKTTRHKM